MLSRFYLIPECYRWTDRQTDGQTDRFAIAMSCVSMLTCDKNCSFLFLSERRHGTQTAEWLKLYAIYTFSTEPDPCYYTTLLNADVLSFYLTQNLLQSVCSDLVSTWRVHTVVTTSLLRGHCQTCALSQDEYFMFQQDGIPAHWKTRSCRFPGARERHETRRHLSTCVHVCGAHFEHKFWQFW